MFYYRMKTLKNFLQEATLMDLRFKGKLGYAVAADAWGRLEKTAVGNVTEQVFYAQSYFPRVPCYS